MLRLEFGALPCDTMQSLFIAYVLQNKQLNVITRRCAAPCNLWKLGLIIPWLGVQIPPGPPAFACSAGFGSAGIPFLLIPIRAKSGSAKAVAPQLQRRRNGRQTSLTHRPLPPGPEFRLRNHSLTRNSLQIQTHPDVAQRSDRLALLIDRPALSWSCPR